MTDQNEKIAVIGMACRFPGANTTDQFWENLRNGKSSITQFSNEELIANGIAEEILANPDYVKSGAWLDHADSFDAAFFGYNPREATMMDPQQRVFLECAYSALEDAGIIPSQSNEIISVYGGVARNTYQLSHYISDPSSPAASGDYQSMIASEKDFLASRVAFKLNLSGPAVNIQTACSSSGVAIHMAIQGLLAGDSTVALAGGGRILAPLHTGYWYEEGGTQSPDGHCRAFDANAKGMVRGSGMGMIALKRLDDATRDGDHIHAVICASAINNDGSEKIGFTAPSVHGQSAVIGDALAISGIDPEQIGYVEAHGTGTALGDPIEISALTRAYREFTDKKAYCPVGSVKTNIGHLDAGASIAGIIKCILILKHGEIPPTVNFKKPNPEIDFKNSPFFVNPETIPWPEQSAGKYAAISSFGLGGTNFHSIIEQWKPIPKKREGRNWLLLPVSAKSESTLANASENLTAYCQTKTDINHADAAFTLQTAREKYNHRSFSVVENRPEPFTKDPTNAYVFSSAKITDTENTEHVFMFTGQGAQYVNMGRGLYENEPVYREQIDRCLSFLHNSLNIELKSILYPNAGDEQDTSEKLSETRYTQPALFITEYALAKLWMSWGIQPRSMIGHSIGEYVAACIAGVFTLEQALQLVSMRGKLMYNMPTGSMLAVTLPSEQVEPYLNESICIAAINTQSNTVLSGPDSQIKKLEKELVAKDISCRILHTSHAFHSSMMDGMLAEFEDVVQQCKPQKPAIPFISNLTGNWITDDEACNAAYWAKHLRNAVKYFEGIGQLFDTPNTTFIEIGPGRTLCNFALQHPERKPEHTIISSLHQPKESSPDQMYLLNALGQAWAAGASPDWQSFYHYEQRQRIPLPTYPFERKSYWYDMDTHQQRHEELANSSAIVADKHSDTSQEPHNNSVLDDTQLLLSEMSGLDTNHIDPQATFLELGLDSLALTQICLAIKKRFAVTVSFRQIMEELSTANELAKFIEEHRTTTGAVNTNAAQMGKSTVTTAPAELTMTTGPWKAIDKGSMGGLTEQQQKHIAELIEKIVEKTPKSKELTQHNRPQLADARTISGFRKVWKELVYPIVAERSSGTRLYDIDGNEFIDIAMGFGVNLFGLSPEFVTQAVQQQLDLGFDIGPQTPLAGEVTALFCEMTGQERAAFCNTGSEAVLAAIRISRTVTARDKIVIFAGSYHGIFDEVLVKNIQSNGQSRAIPIAPGILPQMVQQVIVLNYGDTQSLEEIRRQHSDIAAVLVEPVQSRHPDLQPFEFLRQLRTLTEELDIALIFDEMVTGFRSHLGGVQALAGVKADIATYGKVIGGGLPIGIVGGKSKYLDALDGGMWKYGDDSIPEVGVTWFAGTFVRHPLALAATKSVLLHLKEKGSELQNILTAKTKSFVEILNKTMVEIGAPIHVETFSSFFHIKFKSHQEYSTLLYLHMREKGIYITEGRSSFFSTAHSNADYQAILDALVDSVKELQTAHFLPCNHEQKQQITNIDSSPITESLTASQMEVWLVCHLGTEASCAFNLSNTFKFKGNLNQEILKSSISQLINNHDSLRMTIDVTGTPNYGPAVTESGLIITDLSGLNETEKEEKLTSAASYEVETPYDFIQGPLIRTTLFILGKNEYVLYLSVHHVVCDGWSIAILMRELGEIYSAHSQGSIRDVTPLQFAEYASWLQKDPQQKKSREDENYWKQIHSKPSPNLELPTDHNRPAIKSFNANRVSLTLNDALSKKLPSQASQQKVTLFSYLLTSFISLLNSLTGQDDFTLGISAAGQTQIEGKDLVGHCVNSLPLRITIDKTNSFTENLKITQSMVIEAFEHQFCTTSTLIKQLNLPTDPSRIPLISAAFNIDRLSDCDNFHGVSTNIGSNPRHYEAFDVFFNAVISAENITFECTFNSDLFNDSTIKYWLNLYTNILESSLDNVDGGDISALNTEDKNLILQTWNKTDREYPRELCLHEIISQQCLATPNNTAIIDSQTHLKYCDLDSQSNQLARYLQNNGVKTGTMVGVSLTRSHKMLVAILAILKAGGAYVPLDPDFPKNRLSFMMEDSGLRLIITQSEFQSLIPDTNIKTILLDQKEDDISQLENTPISNQYSSNSIAYVIYTSGSTGKPKGVLVSHKNIVNFIFSMKDDIQVCSDDVFLALTTLSFDIAALEMYLPLILGGHVVIAGKEDISSGEKLLNLITTHKPTVIQATPATWRLLISSNWLGSDNLKILCGGEAMPSDLGPMLKQRAKTVWNMYGPTETTVWSTLFMLNDDDNDASIGKPIANTKIYILDEALRPVPIGVPGELYIGGDGVTLGYHNRPELTAERFINNPFSNAKNDSLYRTGDVARYRHDGNIEYISRVDHQVKIRGYRIELGEIESVLQQHESIKQAVAIVREDRPGDQRLVVYYVPHKQGHQNLALLKGHMKQALPDYMTPQLYIELEELPLGTSGKIDRKALPKPVAVKENTTDDPPETELEKKMASIWKDALGVPSVGIYDNFFELGGHSLLAINMIIQFQKEIGIDISFRSLVTDTLAQVSNEHEKSYADLNGDSSTPPKKRKSGIFGWVTKLSRKQ